MPPAGGAPGGLVAGVEVLERGGPRAELAALPIVMKFRADPNHNERQGEQHDQDRPEQDFGHVVVSYKRLNA